MLTYSVVLYIFEQILRAIRIQVVGEYRAAFFSRRNSKGSHTRKDVRHHLFWPESLDQTVVLRVQPGVPVYLRKIKSKTAIRFILKRHK